MLLKISNLDVSYKTVFGKFKVIEDLNLSISEGERIAMVGESASGKSTLGLVIASMLPKNADAKGSVNFEGTELLDISEKAMTKLRGTSIFMIFQNPLNSLNPVKSIGFQLKEAVRIRDGKNSLKSTEEEVTKEVVDTMNSLRLPDPESMMKRFPHELSGGQVQRVVIAMALILKPKLLIADEPTTALDVTIQAQFLNLLRKLSSELHTALIFITHDIALANSVSDRILVFYSGRVVEIGTTKNVTKDPMHPYTVGLIESIPSSTKNDKRLQPIPGSPPTYLKSPSGCKFHPRCAKSFDKCSEKEPPQFTVEERSVRCWIYE